MIVKKIYKWKRDSKLLKQKIKNQQKRIKLLILDIPNIRQFDSQDYTSKVNS